MRSADDLSRILHRIDGRGYKAYRDIRGSFDLGELTLIIDHVQGDPYATPSKLRVRIPQSLPRELFSTRPRRIALEDHLARRAAAEVQRGIHVDAGAQEVLERSAVLVTDDAVELRLQADLPAAGRRILGPAADALLCRTLPRIAERALSAEHLSSDEATRFVECVENQEHIRALLPERNLVAFVADGSLLPRESGASDRPLRDANAVPFESPESLRVEMPLGSTTITGLGIPRGVTLIVGGGYHGKSTLLRALERGVYPHIPGDGREHIVTDPAVVKIRAEDGRRVERVDIDAFIANLPQARSTTAFSSDDASGSTSQAANIVEAIEAGATGLLLDEDTSATNFMVRDARMQALVHKDHEPITPFLERVRELHESLGVSTVLVMGGVGDYFEVADHVIMMREFRPRDVTAQARKIAADTPARRNEATTPLASISQRIPEASSFDPSRGRRDVKIDAKALDLILYGRDRIDLRGVEQLVDPSQTRAIGLAIHLASERFMNGNATLRRVLDDLDTFLDERGLDELAPFHPWENLARPRRFEIAAAINRLRTVRMVGSGV